MSYLNILLVYAAVDVIACLGLSQQFGIAGVSNFGFIVFQAAGAYVAAILALPSDTANGGFQTYLGGLGLAFPLPWLGATVAGGLLALPFTFLVGRRLRGDFAAIGLLVTAVLLNLLVMNYRPLFNGDAGLALMPAPLQHAMFVSEPAGYQYGFAVGVIVLAAVTYWFVQRITESPYGRTLRAMRDNDKVADSLGKNLLALRTGALVTGGAIAALSGAILVSYVGAWAPSGWTYGETIVLFTAVIIGGAGNHRGAVLGALLVPVGFEEITRFITNDNPNLPPNLLPSLQWVAIGLLIAIFLWLRPQGVLPERRRVIPRPESTARRLARLLGARLTWVTRLTGRFRPGQQAAAQQVTAQQAAAQQAAAQQADAQQAAAQQVTAQQAAAGIAESGQPERPDQEGPAAMAGQPGTAAAVAGQPGGAAAAAAVRSVQAGPPGRTGRGGPVADPEILRVTDVHKDFGGVHAVAGVSMSVRRGTLTGLIGPNGAGKSTLLSLLAGTERTSQGQISYQGRDITAVPAFRRARSGLVRTFQLASEFKRLTVIENLLSAAPGNRGESFIGAVAGRWYWQADEAAAAARAHALLASFGLADLAHSYAGDLSGGQRRLVEIMRALMTEPDMLLLDEPMAGVHPELARRIGDSLRRLCRDGMTILMVEHELAIMDEFCDPVIVMADGAVLAEGTMTELRDRAEVVEAYLVG